MTRPLGAVALLDPAPDLISPVSLTVDGGHTEESGRQMVRTAQLLYTFWHTGEPSFLDRAVAGAFVDNTLPPGRSQGRGGVLAASTRFRRAIPDLTCELSDLLVIADKLAVRLRFRGHFTGVFNGVLGRGQEVDFLALDIQRVTDGRITEDWHLEDNLAFLVQTGLVADVEA